MFIYKNNKFGTKKTKTKYHKTGSLQDKNLREYEKKFIGSIIVRNLDFITMSRFKAACALRGLDMNHVLNEFIQRFTTSKKDPNIKAWKADRRKMDIKKGFYVIGKGYSKSRLIAPINVRGIPIHIRDKYKEICHKRKYTMSEPLYWFMDKYGTEVLKEQLQIFAEEEKWMQEENIQKVFESF